MEKRLATNETQNTRLLNDEETREILTPFAFKLDHTLFGTPLAAAWRRGVAILIDLLLIAMLSSAPGELLAIVIAITVFRLGSKSRAQKMGKVKGRKRRTVMRFLGAFILFIVLLSTLPDLFDTENDNKGYGGKYDTKDSKILIGDQPIDFKSSVKLAAHVAKITGIMKDSQCQKIDCWQKALEPNINKLSELKLSPEIMDEAFTGIVEGTELTKSEQATLHQLLLTSYNSSLPSEDSIQKETSSNQENDDTMKEALATTTEGTQNVLEEKQPEKMEQSQRPVYSFMEFIKGIIEDLGLEFGWAAFYFTAFTATWKGQTPGKKLLKIKVLQLDGTPLSLWDSFGRYGGYGAGIATGLLGFLQIYWDPNRQAIHDKISATIVVNADYKQLTKLEDSKLIDSETTKENS